MGRLFELFEKIQQILASQFLDALGRENQGNRSVDAGNFDAGQVFQGFEVAANDHVTVFQFEFLKVGNHRVCRDLEHLRFRHQ